MYVLSLFQVLKCNSLCDSSILKTEAISLQIYQVYCMDCIVWTGRTVLCGLYGLYCVDCMDCTVWTGRTVMCGLVGLYCVDW